MFPRTKVRVLSLNVAKKSILYFFIIFILTIFGFVTINSRHSLIYMHEVKQPEPVLLNIRNSNLGTKTYDYVNATNDSTKYILLWTSPKCFPFVYFGEGNKVFIEKRCKWKNCYVTSDRNYLGRYTEFDVIAFNGPQLSLMVQRNDIPMERSSHQKYVYANIESAKNYPVRTNRFEGFFNWTWTYKLNSDAVWGYFVVKDASDNVIGPSEHMHWMSVDTMDPIDDHFKNRLRSKTKAAVWFSSNCLTKSRREDYVYTLQQYLRYYNMDVDIYGTCGPSQCPKQIMQRCLNMVRREYYFYLAFENSFSDDYVTEKVVSALNHDAVPVVYGGANYSRFLPEGIYLDAVKLSPEILAKTMYNIIQDPKRYHNFFRWKNHYSFQFKHECPDTDDYCKFCATLNNNTMMRSHSVYSKFSAWWMNQDNSERKLPDTPKYCYSVIPLLDGLYK